MTNYVEHFYVPICLPYAFFGELCVHIIYQFPLGLFVFLLLSLYPELADIPSASIGFKTEQKSKTFFNMLSFNWKFFSVHWKRGQDGMLCTSRIAHFCLRDRACISGVNTWKPTKLNQIFHSSHQTYITLWPCRGQWEVGEYGECTFGNAALKRKCAFCSSYLRVG